ncbi:MAG: hypothetical protein ABIF77_14275 [bacterium]
MYRNAFRGCLAVTLIAVLALVGCRKDNPVATLTTPLEFTVSADDFVVEFPDSYLEDRIRAEIDVPAPMDIMFSDLEGLESLQLFNKSSNNRFFKCISNGNNS